MAETTLGLQAFIAAVLLPIAVVAVAALLGCLILVALLASLFSSFIEN